MLQLSGIKREAGCTGTGRLQANIKMEDSSTGLVILTDMIKSF